MCGGILNCNCYKFITEFISEITLKIGHHLAKLEVKYSGSFFEHCIYVGIADVNYGLVYMAASDCD